MVEYNDVSSQLSDFIQLFDKAKLLIGTDYINSGYLQDTNINSLGAIVTGQIGFQVANIPFLNDSVQQVIVSNLPSTSAKYYRWVDRQGNTISFGVIPSTTQVFNRPSGAVVLQFNLRRSTAPVDPENSKDSVMVNKGSKAFPYLNFNDPGIIFSVRGKEIMASILKEGSTLGGNPVATTNLIPKLTIAYSKQLVDVSTIATDNRTVNGIWIDRFVSTSGAITATSGAVGWMMANILIKYNTTTKITISGGQMTSGRYWRILDAAGNVLANSGSTQYDGALTTIDIPSGAAVLQINIKRNTDNASIINSFMANFGATAAPLESYGSAITHIDGVQIGATAKKPILYIVVYGDSTTFGADLANPELTRWSTLFGNYFDVVIINLGSSGARAEEITARMGGVFPNITVNGGVIIPNTFVAVSYPDINPLRSGAVVQIDVDLYLQNGNKVSGVLHQTNGFKATSISSNINTGSQPLRMVSLSGKARWSNITILGQGINNEPLIVDGTQTIDDVKGWYMAAASVVKGDFFVWGVLDRGPNEKPGTVIGDYIVELEKFLKLNFGAKYIPFRQYLISPQALSDALLFNPAFVPTAADLAAQAVKTTPPSFRSGSGSVHLNELGHQLQALYFKKFLEFFLM